MPDSSVVDPGCLPRVPDPDFYPSRYPGSRIPDPGSRIPDPKTATKERGEEKICCHTFFCSHIFHKIVNYFIFEMRKKNLGQFSKNHRTFYTKKLSLSSQKYGFGDLGS